MNIFVDKFELESYSKRAYQNTATSELLKYFRAKREMSQAFFIDLEELERILKWKLINQYGRQRAIRSRNTNDNIILMTRAAFGITHEDKQIETRLKINILRCIIGVEVAVASAILAICYPEDYGVIDFRNWRQLFPDKIQKNKFGVKDYERYMNVIKGMAMIYHLSPQQIDIAIWQKYKEQFG